MWLALLGARRIPTLALLRALVGTAALVAAISFAVALAIPSVGFQPNPSAGLPELRGIFAHQLRLGLFQGTVVGVIVIAAINGEYMAIMGRTRLTRAITLLLIGSCAVAPISRLYSVTVFIALALTVLLLGSTRWRLLAAFGFVAGTITLAVYWDRLVGQLDSVEGGATLSGRTNTWERTARLAAQADYGGYGYSTFDSPIFDGAFTVNYRPLHAHNSFLQSYFELGLIGLTIVVGIVVAMLAGAAKVRKSLGRIPYSAFLVIVVALASLTGHSITGTPTTAFWLAFVLYCTETSEAARTRKINRGDVRNRGPYLPLAPQRSAAARYRETSR
ncbi:hypothetical protein GCM10009816_13600 [Microbacterium aquimaris]